MTEPHPVPDPAARLQAAATQLRTLLTAIATESPADLPLHADGRTITQGRIGLHPYAKAETPEVAAFITAMGPAVATAVVAVLEQAARRYGALQDAAGHTFSDGDPEGRQEFMAGALRRIGPALALADAILATDDGTAGGDRS